MTKGRRKSKIEKARQKAFSGYIGGRKIDDTLVRRLPLYAGAIMGSGSSPPPQSLFYY